MTSARALICTDVTGLVVRHAAYTPAGDVALMGTGDLVVPPPGLHLSGPADRHWFAVTTWDGARLVAAPTGQSREDEGTFGMTRDVLAIRYHRGIDLHALPSLARTGRLRGTEGPAALRFLDERRLLALDADALTLWDIHDTAVLARADTTGSLAFTVSPDGRFAVVAGRAGGMHAVHALPSLERMTTFGAPRSPAGAVAFSPSGRLLVTGDWDAEVVLWDGFDGPTTVLGRHGGCVDALSFVDEHTVVSGGWDGAVMRWDVAAPLSGHRLGGHTGVVTAVDLSPDRQTVLTASTDGTVRHWDPAAVRAAPPGESVVPRG